MAFGCDSNLTQLKELGLLFILHLLMLRVGPSLGKDSVAEDIGIHQLQRLLDLLTVHECEELLLALSSPEENIFNQLERLSAEKNQLELSPRKRRDIDKETHCQPALTDWLQAHGMEMYYDRLSRALQQIGRTDIAIEVAKNINQDKILALRRYVDAYHARIHEAESWPTRSGAGESGGAGRSERLQHPTKNVRDLSWKDLDLVVERHPAPPYGRGMLDGAWPLLYGLLLGFAGAFIIGVAVLLITIHISLHDRQKLQRLSTQPKDKSQTQRRRRQPVSSTLTAGVSAENSPLKQSDSQPEAAGLSLLF